MTLVASALPRAQKKAFGSVNSFSNSGILRNPIPTWMSPSKYEKSDGFFPPFITANMSISLKGPGSPLPRFHEPERRSHSDILASQRTQHVSPSHQKASSAHFALSPPAGSRLPHLKNRC